ncbi:MAG: hypothetical protein JKX85_12985 [Phycisphaeraceae bacterium]|nr:hypothetical protein [Phycisphaeraceae bacterium]
MQNSTQICGIHTGLVLFAQGNNTYYPGINTIGTVLTAATALTMYPTGAQSTETGAEVPFRFRELLEDNYFTGEYITSPSETLDEWASGDVTKANFSYALDDISVAGGRRNEWRETSNSEAVVLGDRAKLNGAGFVKSVHTNPTVSTNEWRGSVGFNDNHVTFEATHDQLDTQFADTSVTNDNLFNTVGVIATNDYAPTTGGPIVAAPDNGNLAWETSSSGIDLIN